MVGVDSNGMGTLLSKLQTQMGLSDWRIELSDEPADDGYSAQVHYDTTERAATVRVSDALFEAPAAEVELTLLHELAHLFDPEPPEAPLWEEALDNLYVAFKHTVRAAYADRRERMTEDIAKALRNMRRAKAGE